MTYQNAFSRSSNYTWNQVICFEKETDSIHRLFPACAQCFDRFKQYCTHRKSNFGGSNSVWLENMAAVQNFERGAEHTPRDTTTRDHNILQSDVI